MTIMGDPLSPILAYKEAGLLLVACVLFIANYIQNKELATTSEGLSEVLDTITKTITDSASVTTASKDKLAELQAAQERLQQLTQDKLLQGVMDGFSKLSENQRVLAESMVHLTSSMQQIIDRLLGIVERD